MPMERSLIFLRKRGYEAEALERFMPHPPPGHLKDVFGCDILGIAPAAPPVLVQTTSRSGMSSRKKKLDEIEALKWWVLYARLELHGWDLPDVEPKRWRCKVMEFTLVDGEYQWVGILGKSHA
jgi:hypothetical protein